MATFTNRVFDAVASAFVRWNTATPDTSGTSYPGPDAFVNTFDFCIESVVPAVGGGITDHDMLLGLGDDDHLQYALLAGRAGGQALTGGTGPADTLTLRATTNGSPGDHDIILLDNLDLSTFDIFGVGSLTAEDALFEEVSVTDELVVNNVLGGDAAGSFTTNDGDVQNVLVLQTTTSVGGTNPGLSNVYVGNRDPNSNVDAPEGSLYIQTLAGSATLWIKNTITGTLTGWINLGDTTATPAGSDTEIQFNDSGSFGASPALTWDGATFNLMGNAVGDVSWSVVNTTTPPAYSALVGTGDSLPVMSLQTDNGAATNGSETKVFVGDRDPNLIPLTGFPEGSLYVRADQTSPSDSTIYICVDQNTPIWEDLRSGGATTTELHIYIDPIGGDDNDNGTLSSPIQTMAEAERRIPIQVYHPVVLHLRAEDYTMVRFRRRTLGAGIYFLADKAWDSGVETSIASGLAADGGTGANVVVDTGLVADAWNGFTIEITSGAASGQRRTIRDNTTTDIVPVEPFSPAPASGDSYKITRWNTCRLIFPLPGTFQAETFFEGGDALDSTTFGHLDDHFSGHCFIGVGLHASLNGVLPIFKNGTYLFYGCEKSYGGTVIANNGWFPTFARSDVGFGCRESVTFGGDFLTFPPISLSSSQLWRGWGLYQDASDLVTAIRMAGSTRVAMTGHISHISSSELSVDDDFEFVGRISSPATITAIPTVFGTNNVKMRIGRLLGVGTKVINGQGNIAVGVGTSSASPTQGRPFVAVINTSLSSTGAVGHLIDVYGPCDVYLEGVSGNNSAVGARALGAFHGAAVRINGDPSSLGDAVKTDYDVGNGAAQNKAFFDSANDHLAHTDGSVILRVI